MEELREITSESEYLLSLYIVVVILGGHFRREIVALKSVVFKVGRSRKHQNFPQAGMFRRALVG